MGAKVNQINVASAAQLENTISSYIAQGFVVSNRTPDSATLYKKKEFNVVWAVIGFFLCILPLLIYTIVYATQSDEMIILKLATGGDSGELTWSDDRQWWWDGTKWRDSSAEIPPGAELSEDRASWWDGTTWRPVPAVSSLQVPPPPPAVPAASGSGPPPPPRAPSTVIASAPDATSERVSIAEGWWQDPLGHHPDRYWDGKAWTKWVRDKPGGTRSEDPLASNLAAEWYPDPARRHPDRYWDGKAWTKWVRDKPGGTRSEDLMAG